MVFATPWGSHFFDRSDEIFRPLRWDFLGPGRLSPSGGWACRAFPSPGGLPGPPWAEAGPGESPPGADSGRWGSLQASPAAGLLETSMAVGLQESQNPKESKTRIQEFKTHGVYTVFGHGVLDFGDFGLWTLWTSVSVGLQIDSVAPGSDSVAPPTPASQGPRPRPGRGKKTMVIRVPRRKNSKNTWFFEDSWRGVLFPTPMAVS